jgi:hypothetical protein
LLLHAPAAWRGLGRAESDAVGALCWMLAARVLAFVQVSCLLCCTDRAGSNPLTPAMIPS